MSVAAGVGSVLQLRSKVDSRSFSKQQNNGGMLVVAPQFCRFGKRSSRSYAVRRSEAKICESKFFGNRLRSDRLHQLNVRSPNHTLRFGIRSALSQVPEQPLGLYDPKNDKDSCGVGFVSELSGESSRKTVRLFTFIFF